MDAPPPRHARLVLVTRDGNVLGAAAPFPVETPWWQEVGPVVRGARAHLGVDVTVLRRIDSDLPEPPGGLVTYLAETDQARPDGLAPWAEPLDDDPRRMPWARPGGPAADLVWVDRELRRHGLMRAGPAEQIRSWNLSSLWRVPLEGESAAVWLKHVPPFFGHEARLIRRLTGGPVPTVMAADGGRMLMPELPGTDLYEADAATLERLVDALVTLQAGWIGRVDELLQLGLPDWRPAALTTAIRDVVSRTAGELGSDDRAVLDAFVADLPARFARLAGAGIPDTLVHGDFHPGNARGDGSWLVLLDWGDAGVGHPMLDQAAFLDRIPPRAVPRVQERWRRAWRRALPAADPDAAAGLLAPVAAARQAVIYRGFLDQIEPSEQPYHLGDPATWLARAAALVRAEASGG